MGKNNVNPDLVCEKIVLRTGYAIDDCESYKSTTTFRIGMGQLMRLW